MVPPIFSGLGTTLLDLTEKEWEPVSTSKMADCVAALRQLVEKELQNISSSVSTDPLEALEKINQVMVAVNFLDSVVWLPEDIYGDSSAARRI